MSDKTWKKAERCLAGILGLVRAGAVGKEGPDLIAPDSERTWMAPECKAGHDRVPGWLQNAVDQAVMNAAADQFPFVILHRTGDRFLDALVVMRLHDILEWKEKL